MAAQTKTIPDIANELRHAAVAASVSADNDQYYCSVSIAQAKRAADEIERLRQRLAKIAHAPVPKDNEPAMTLKGWAMARDGEFPYA